METISQFLTFVLIITFNSSKANYQIGNKKHVTMLLIN